MESRLMTLCELANYLSKSEEEFIECEEQLYVDGMPKQIPSLCRWDRKAVDVWLDYMSQLTGNHFSEPRYPSRPFIHPLNRCPPSEPPKQHGLEEDASAITVSHAMDDYLRCFTGVASSKRDSIYQINGYINPILGDTRIIDLRAEQIRDWLQQLANRPRRLRTKRGQPPQYDQSNFDDEAKRRRRGSANRALTILKAGLNLAYRDGRAPSDDAWRRVKPFPGTIIKQGTYLTAEQCRKLVKLLPQDFRKFVQTALLTGARFSELRDLTPKSFNSDAGSLFIKSGKYQKTRNIILNDEGIRHFTNIVKDVASDDLILKRLDGKMWGPTDPYDRLDAGCQLAGITPRVTFHQLRHTYASLAVMAGVPLVVVSQNLGHANTNACERFYAHLAPSFISDSIREGLPTLGIL